MTALRVIFWRGKNKKLSSYSVRKVFTTLGSFTYIYLSKYLKCRNRWCNLVYIGYLWRNRRTCSWLKSEWCNDLAYLAFRLVKCTRRWWRREKRPNRIVPCVISPLSGGWSLRYRFRSIRGPLRGRFRSDTASFRRSSCEKKMAN